MRKKMTTTIASDQPTAIKPHFQNSQGDQSELIDDWQTVAIEQLGEAIHSNRALRVFLDTCVNCGACTDKCHYFLGDGDAKNMPVVRQNLIRGVYRRYFTLAGKIAPKLVGAFDLTEAVIDDWSTYYYQCSQCRRCSVYCPFGIDTAEITMAGRAMLDAIGLKQKYIHTVLDNVERTGNNLGMIGPAIADTLQGLEEDVYDDTGVRVRFPLDEAGADLLLLVPSADFFAEPHVDGLIGCAKIFHQQGIRWTLSTGASEAANFALFVGDQAKMRSMAEQIRQTALQLGVRQIVIGECGHAWRVASSFWPDLLAKDGSQDALDYDVLHICELTYEWLQKGALRLDRSVHRDKVITFHDSCNVARGTRMGTQPQDVYDIPRALLRAACDNFVDMASESIREYTYCCGGGGGLLTDELMDIRTSGALPRVSALETVIADHGVTHMAAICAICKSQFLAVLPRYGLDMRMIVSLHQIIGDAVLLDAD